ncbi:hypothetical protein LJC49_07505 [Ruminococcaceae bacterium OttesenSCG-928-I18]|nr:hypothetical protein [Ruminococcaceae bacterium OttesenSCG-928-I18]
MQSVLGGNTKNVPGFLRPLLLVLLVSFLLALLLGSGFTLTTHGLPEQELSFATAYGEGATLLEDGSVRLHTGHLNTITFYDLTQPARTLGLSTSAYGQESISVTATLYHVGYGADGAERLTQLDQAVLNPAGSHRSAVLMLRQENASAQNPYNIRLVFTDAKEDFLLNAATLNQGGFSFNVGQFVLFSVLGLSALGLYRSRIYRVEYDHADRQHRLLLWVGAGLCAMAVLLLMQLVLRQGYGLLYPYDPFSPDSLIYNDDYHTQYYHLFDALLHGQLAMRTPPDPQLLTLANPYDPVQREGIYSLWDMAYFDGKYYCYYGPAPMPLYFLCDFLFAKVPSAALACAVPAGIAVFGICGALQEMLRYFKIRSNLLLLMLSIPALCFGTLLFLLMSCADSYEQPYLWAMAGLSCFLWLYYLALRWKHALVRKLFYLLAGGSVVFVAASRPAVVLLCIAFALPPAIDLLKNSKGRLRGLWADAVFLLLPIFAGAALLMAYNALRFGSVLNFGNTMQFTVWDMNAQTFRASPVWLVQALWLFLFHPLHILPRFPYVLIRDSLQNNYGSFFYNYGLFGLVNLPLYWSLAGVGKALRKAPLVKKAVYLLVLLSSALLLWYTYCIGNIVYRYICDVTVALGLLAALLLLEIASCRPAGEKKLVYLAAVLLCSFTILVGFLLCFQNERMLIRQYSPDFYILISRLFQLG